jgi:DNA polymerase III sliding clamp (beta) subunit (PCNA family)
MISSSELKKAVATVIGCCDGKSSLPSLQCLAFKDGRVMASNGSVVCSVDIETGFEGLVDSTAFSLWLKALSKKQDEIRAERTDAGITFEAATNSLKLGCYPVSEFPPYELPQSTDPAVRIDATESIDALKVCKGCIGTDFSREQSGLFIEWDGNGAVMFRSTDGVAAVEVKLEASSEGDVDGCVTAVPHNVIDHLLKTGGVSEIVFQQAEGESGPMVWFRTKALIGSRTRKVPESAQIVEVLDRCGSSEMVDLTDEVCEAFDTIAPVAMLGDLSRMEATIWDNAIEFQTGSATVVGARSSAPFQHEALDVEKRVAFSARSLGSLLDYADAIHIPTDPLGQIYVRSDCLRGVLALIRL